MTRPVVVLDACVLYPAQVRSLFLYLAGADLFRPRWTNAIHDEWTRNLLEDRPDFTPATAGGIRGLMDAHVPNCLVSGYEALIPALVLPDPDDRHVLAAAVQCGATAIVTFNLTDFPPDALNPFQVEAVHPDEFAWRFVVEQTADVCAAVARHRASLKNPPKTIDEYFEILERGGFVKAVAALRPFAAIL